MSEEASLLSSIPIIDTIEISPSTTSSTRPFTSDSGHGWREDVEKRHNGDVDGTHEP